MSIVALFAVGLLLVSSCCSTVFATTKCNGMVDLCDLRINQATFAGSHNAGSGFDGRLWYWSGAEVSSCTYRNHSNSFSGQLDLGIRMFDIDTCYDYKKAINCQCGSPCGYTSSVEKGLRQIDTWMKSNPNEVIVIHFNRDAQEGYRNDIANSVENTLLNLWSPNNAKKLSMSTYYKSNNRWPTLGEAIASNQRIIVFIDNNLAQHLDQSQRWLVRSNGIIGSTWKTNPLTSSCYAIITNAKSKCTSNAQFMDLSAFGSYGLCIWDMARLCSNYIGRAQDECLKKRKANGNKTVNFLLVDWIQYFSGENSVMVNAKIMNKKNIKNYLGRDIP